MRIPKIRDEQVTIDAPAPYYLREVTRTVARCRCGAEVLLLDPLDNDCPECGAIYNMSGQEVECYARDVDPLDAGERYDED